MKKTQKQTHQFKQHQPVLLNQVLEYLNPQVGERYLDLTAGYGGHASSVMERIVPAGEAVLVDRDEKAVSQLRHQFRGSHVKIVHSDFASAALSLTKHQEQFDMILLDLGVSSPQLDEAERGFSFRSSGPLDMRMDTRVSTTAADLIHKLSEDELTTLIRTYGEEPAARRIAHAIVARRPFTTTIELAECIDSLFRHRGRIHPATRTFQALRMAVNEELAQLKMVLPLSLELLREEGRLVIISFHSLEDRLVKQFFNDHSRHAFEAKLRLLTPKPVSGRSDAFNPRARSARLRAAAKIKINTRKE